MSSIAAITTTPSGLRCLAPLCQKIAQLWVSPKLQREASALKLDHCVYDTSLADFLKLNWQQYDGFIFCLASGAVVRLISPLLTDKASDPAVVVVDSAGKFAISLCGGHQGGGDRLTQKISQLLGAQPVLTGASSPLGLSGIDTLGVPFGWVRGPGDWTGVSAAIAAEQPVQVLQEAGSDLWQAHLPAGHPFQFGFPEFADRENQGKPQARVWISPIRRKFDETSSLPKVQWYPRVLWLGIGCERDTDKALIEYAIEKVCHEYHLAMEAIAGVATLDLKADEVGLLELVKEKNWPLRCFSASVLKKIAVPNPSQVVQDAVRTPSVSEAAAIAVADDWNRLDSVSDDLEETRASDLRVKKQVVKHPDYKGAVTVAIAQAEIGYTGRTGKLHLVGTGPGSLDQITPAAKAAITDADVVIGYELYVDLIKSLLRPGQIVEALPITQERQRAERAIALAKWGLTVAVISSGDCGIYGMAGLVLEELRAQNWNGKTPAVQVFPGVSALQSAASRVGAPLMHDFCAISLSNLLTPWEVIEKRLKAAASADFIVALYNPKSKTRTKQIEFARDTFLQHRGADTPVALARSLYRPDEKITITTLGDMLDSPIDMLTTVIIGNRSSRSYAGWFITPRGYLGDLVSN
ncbi:MAG: precorrin-3B C(17)-methyltransferase [Leptolyngbya foveolarum]|uniref:Precorrin-3B C(17)-methyltransferase n=1 Tax=Leptolyngbya foveolarum TaxID=47253 RepID=A0A2W4UM89_9CYAN|nr:MAG: precorrin-3B C(17)-methyltransferase [Leptolyngbya foveolarum]